MNEKFKDVPMCCGTPLKDNKCTVCGDSYDENGRWVVVDTTKELTEILNKSIKAMEAIIFSANSLKIDIMSALTYGDAYKKFRLYDLDRIETDLSFFNDDVKKMLEEANTVELSELVIKLTLARKNGNKPMYVRKENKS